MKQRLLQRNITAAIDNKIENLVIGFINEYLMNKQEDANSEVNQEESVVDEEIDEWDDEPAQSRKKPDLSQKSKVTQPTAAAPRVAGRSQRYGGKDSNDDELNLDDLEDFLK